MSEQRDKNRAAVQRIVDKIGNDAAFRQQLVNDPGRALQELGLGGTAEVSGYLMMLDCDGTCLHSCKGTCSGVTCQNGVTD